MVNTFGLLSACRYNKYGHSNSCSGFAHRRHLAERNEKVSPTRNNNARSRCASHCNDISVDDTILQPSVHSFWRNRSCRHAYSGDHDSCIHRDRRSHPWHLANRFLASKSGDENMLREKRRHACYNNIVVNSSGNRHHPVPENHSTILVSTHFSISVKSSNRTSMKKIISGLFQEL
jgi:hypothetical protein